MMRPAKQLSAFVNIIPEQNMNIDLRSICRGINSVLGDKICYLLAAVMEGTERNLCTEDGFTPKFATHKVPIPITTPQNVVRVVGSGSKLQTINS